MSHTQCSHLSGNLRQPTAAITINGKVGFHCMVCFSEAIASMAGKETFGVIAGTVSFARCSHERPQNLDHCGVCMRGCTAYLSAIAYTAWFDNRTLSNQLRKVINEITARHLKGWRPNE
jgi:hypothetical protein